MKKIYILVLLNLLFILNNSYSQGNTCSQATPFCTAVGTPFVYPNVSNGSLAPTGNSYGCLCQSDADNPSWFYLKTTAAGTLNFTMSQVNNGGTGIDVDFVAWGPFSSVASMCSGLSGSCSSNCTSNSNVTCTGNIEDCGSSPSSVETMSLVSTAADQYFLIMITNFDGDAGTITLTQNSGPPTNCDITCPSVLSGPGIVQAQSIPSSGTPAVNLPAVVSCTSGVINMYASDNTPFGHPIQPAVAITTYANGQNGNTIRWYEDGGLVLTSGQTTPNTSHTTLFIGVDPTAVTSFSFCETVNSSDMPSAISDAATGALIANYTWVSNGGCSGYTLPAGSVKGITSWTSTCGACLTNVSNWGFAQFNPSAAGIGTHTITYSFNPQKAGCSTYTTQAVITVTNPFNATFTPPGPLCANAACTILTPANVYGVGTSGWAGTGVSSNSFCPTSSGSGTFPVTYSVGTSATCRATYSANVVVNPIPAVTATAANSGTLCSGSSINLSSGGADTYTWTPGGSNSSAITVTPSASPTTYTVQGTTTATGCRNQAVVSVTVIPTPTVNVTGPLGTNTSSICMGGSSVLTASGGSTYTWSPATGLSSTNGAVVTANPTITTVYTVGSSSAGGCNSTASTQGSFTVYVNPTPTIGITPANSGTVCSGSTISLTGTGAGAGTYSWTAPAGGGLSSTTGSPVNITPTSSPLTYTVIGTSVAGCTNTAQTTVTVAPSPTISVTNTLSSNSSTICSGNSVVLSASGATTYTWSPATGLSSTSGATVTASPTNTSAPIVYTVTGTTTSGCLSPASSQGTFTVTVRQTPTIGITPANSGTVCSGSTISLTGTGAGAGTYSWTAPAGGGLSSTTGSPVNITPTSSPLTYTVIGTSVAGCTNTAQTTVTVAPSPTISVTNTLSSNSSTICSGNSVVLSASGATTYTWSPATGLSSTSGATVTASPTNTSAPIVYTVTGTTTSGCLSPASSQGTFTVTVNSTPTVTSVSGTNSMSVCAGSPVSGVSFSVNPAGSINWTNNNTSIGLGASGSGGTIPTFTAASVTSPTTAIITVTATATSGGCSTTSSTQLNYSITVNPLPVVNFAVTSVTSTCSSPTVVLSAISNPSTGVTYSWTAPASGSLNTYTVSNPVASGDGVFTVTATGVAGGCSSSVSQATIEVIRDAAAPSVSVSPSTLSLTCNNTTVTAAVTSTNTISSYSWSPAPVTGGANPVFNTPNVYNGTVTASNGCRVNISVNVVADNLPPVISLSSSVNNGTITCNNPSVTITPTITPSSNLSYTWSPSAGISSSVNQASATFTAAGIYTLAVTNTLTGCVTSSTNTANTFTVYENNATPTFTLGTASTVTTTCALPNATLSASSNANPNSVYTWITPTSSTITGNPIISSTTGIYTVVVTNTINGCSTSSTSAQYTVEVIADAGVPTVSLSTSSVSITCTNPTPSVSITTTVTPVTYSWSPSAGIVTGTETTSTPSFSAPGTYSVVVTNTATGCATSVSGNIVTVDLDNTPSSVSLSSTTNQGTITCINPTVVVTPTVTPTNGNLTYSWSPSAGISSPSGQASASFTAAGVYTLVVTNTLTGCVTSSTNTANTFTVYENTTIPSMTLTTGAANDGTITCNNPSVVITPTIIPSNATYTWTSSSGVISAAATVTLTTPGVYTLSVTDATTGCVSSNTNTANTFTVYQNTTAPTMTLTAGATNDGTITCNNPSVVITPTIIPSNATYTWTSSSGVVSTAATVTLTTPGVYTLSVTDATTGCISSNTNTANTFTVYQNTTAPTMTLTTGATNDGTITCSNPSVIITPNIIPSSATYTWTSGSGVVSTAATVTLTTPGVYTLSVTDAITGCVSSNTNTANTFTVYLDNVVPTASINAVSTNSIIGCGGSSSTVTLGSTITSSNTPIITWLPVGINTTTLGVTSAGVYTLVVTDAVNSCSTSTQFTVDGNTTPPQGVDAGTNVFIPCTSPTVTLNGISTSTNVSFSWSGPSATSIASGSNTANPIVNEPGIYTLTVTDNLTGCQSTTTVNVSQSNVTAAFSADPATGLAPLTVNFTDESIGATSWNWNFGDSNSSNQQNPSNIFTTGSYTVVLTAISGVCTSTASVVIVVEDGLTLEIPNVFTPNADGSNDVFTIKTTGVKEISLQIFNRWGEILYEFSGPKASWDGLAQNGSEVPEGTYFYFVKVTGFEGKTIEKHSTVNLFR